MLLRGMFDDVVSHDDGDYMSQFLIFVMSFILLPFPRGSFVGDYRRVDVRSKLMMR